MHMLLLPQPGDFTAYSARPKDRVKIHVTGESLSAGASFHRFTAAMETGTNSLKIAWSGVFRSTSTCGLLV